MGGSRNDIGLGGFLDPAVFQKNFPLELKKGGRIIAAPARPGQQNKQPGSLRLVVQDAALSRR